MGFFQLPLANGLPDQLHRFALTGHSALHLFALGYPNAIDVCSRQLHNADCRRWLTFFETQ